MVNIVSFGAGTNSVAMTLLLMKHGIQIDYITFSDTGGERQFIYDYIAMFSTWLQQCGQRGIDTLRYKGKYPTLEAECLALGILPSIAFGWKTCSQKWKIYPFQKWLKEKAFTEEVVVFIGYDAGEPERAERANQSEAEYARRYPLIEWDISREDCIAIIRAAGLPQPGKSACFFCPSSRKEEVAALPDDLRDRALAIEDGAAAKLGSVKGLGRRWNWRQFLENPLQWKGSQFEMTLELPCDCHD